MPDGDRSVGPEEGSIVEGGVEVQSYHSHTSHRGVVVAQLPVIVDRRSIVSKQVSPHHYFHYYLQVAKRIASTAATATAGPTACQCTCDSLVCARWVSALAVTSWLCWST